MPRSQRSANGPCNSISITPSTAASSPIILAASSPIMPFKVRRNWPMGSPIGGKSDLHALFAVTRNGHYLSDAGKVRQLFALPDAAKKEFFYGINFELSYETQAFSPAMRWNMEIRPIVGWRKNDYELIINPIVDL